VARSLVELLRQDADLEAEIVALYDEAVRFCRRTRDEDNALFFEGLLEEEREHAREIADWLATLEGSTRAEAGQRVFF
jgi:bacterioferritin